MKFRQVFRIDQQRDASGDARFSGDQTFLFEGQDHLMNAWWCDGEEALHIRLGRGLAHDERIGMDEGQILALPVSKGGILGRIVPVG